MSNETKDGEIRKLAMDGERDAEGRVEVVFDGQVWTVWPDRPNADGHTCFVQRGGDGSFQDSCKTLSTHPEWFAEDYDERQRPTYGDRCRCHSRSESPCAYCEGGL